MAVTAGLSHEDTKTQRGTKAYAVTEVFVCLGAFVAFEHFSRFIPPPFTTTPHLIIGD